MSNIAYMDIIRNLDMNAFGKMLDRTISNLQSQLGYEVEIQYSTATKIGSQIEYSALIIGRLKEC